MDSSGPPKSVGVIVAGGALGAYSLAQLSNSRVAATAGEDIADFSKHLSSLTPKHSLGARGPEDVVPGLAHSGGDMMINGRSVDVNLEFRRIAAHTSNADLGAVSPVAAEGVESLNGLAKGFHGRARVAGLAAGALVLAGVGLLISGR